MDEVFSDHLDRETLRPLLQRRAGPTLRRAALQFGLLAVSGVALARTDDPVLFALAFAMQALMQAATFGLLHEAIHGNAFASRGANRAAQWLCAPIQCSPPAWLRAFHFAHHRHTHELGADPELAGLAWMLRWPRGPVWLFTVCGLPVLGARLVFLFASATGLRPVFARLLPFVADGERAAVARDARILLVLYAALAALTATWCPGLRWCWLAALPAHAVLAIYQICEHRGLPAHGDVVHRARSLRSPFFAWLLWNLPLHAEHHACPGVPFHALPRLHALLRPWLVHVGSSPLALHWRGGH